MFVFVFFFFSGSPPDCPFSVKTKEEFVIISPMTRDFSPSSCSNGLQVFHSQLRLIRTDFLATGQNYKTVQREKKRKDKGWGVWEGKIKKNKASKGVTSC